MIIPVVGVSVWFIVKIFVLFALALYIIFALVIVKQVSLMITTLNAGFELPIRVLSYSHLGFAVFVLLLALFIL